MKTKKCFQAIIASTISLFTLITITNVQADNGTKYVFKAGDPSLQEWLLPDRPPIPRHNYPTKARIALGKMLFFDPRISRDGNMSCATCHNPVFGWADGLPFGIGYKGKKLGRSSPVVTNTAYNSIQMWDGRKKDLEDQATGPMETAAEMNSDMHAITQLFSNKGYKAAFDKAYPGEPISPATAAKALASYEWTIVSNDSPFDNWVRGDETAMTEQQINGFKLFVDPNKGNCAACHNAPNFTDNGFHNVGLKSYGEKNPDMGRYAKKPIRILKGAFKTPTLRDITLSAPYFHNGEAKTLMEVMVHYNKGGLVKKDLDPNIKPLHLSQQEMEDIVAFMQALTTPPKPVTLPQLPLE